MELAGCNGYDNIVQHGRWGVSNFPLSHPFSQAFSVLRLPDLPRSRLEERVWSVHIPDVLRGLVGKAPSAIMTL